ncbi:hypothetical protein [Comamonas sp.]|uniref:hypothetical protein n=1 Tax=Comamonas sp. TaxID=34028 RepID=UPI0028A1C9BB|nr:hypothetical protein [Comamonas sp.]
MFIFGITLTAIVYLLILNKFINLIYKKASIKKYLQINILAVVVFFAAASTDVLAIPSTFLMQIFSNNLNNFFGNTPSYIKFPISIMAVYSPLLFIAIGVISAFIFFQRNFHQLLAIYRSIKTADVKYNLINSRHETFVMASACILYFYFFGVSSLIGILVNSILFLTILSITIFYPEDNSPSKIIVRFFGMLLMVLSTNFFTSNENKLDYYMNFVIPIFYVSSAVGFYLNFKAK